MQHKNETILEYAISQPFFVPTMLGRTCGEEWPFSAINMETYHSAENSVRGNMPGLKSDSKIQTVKSSKAKGK